MTSQCTAQLLADLGVTRSLSRPQVSDDNPFSEALRHAVFGVQNLEVPSLVSRTVRGSGPGQNLLSLVLPLVQCRALLADLGVTRSLSRPQVSDDNPFSEAQFKTLKYHPSFPGQFGDQGQAKTFCRSFFRWYNAEHRHGGISANPRAGPLRERRSGHRRQEIRAPRSMGRSSRTLRQRCAEAQTAPGGRLHQSSHPFPHHTGHCSLINPVECPIVVTPQGGGEDGPDRVMRNQDRSIRLPSVFLPAPGSARWQAPP